MITISACTGMVRGRLTTKTGHVIPYHKSRQSAYNQLPDTMVAEEPIPTPRPKGKSKSQKSGKVLNVPQASWFCHQGTHPSCKWKRCLCPCHPKRQRNRK